MVHRSGLSQYGTKGRHPRLDFDRRQVCFTFSEQVHGGLWYQFRTAKLPNKLVCALANAFLVLMIYRIKNLGRGKYVIPRASNGCDPGLLKQARSQSEEVLVGLLIEHVFKDIGTGYHKVATSLFNRTGKAFDFVDRHRIQ